MVLIYTGIEVKRSNQGRGRIYYKYKGLKEDKHSYEERTGCRI